MIIELKATNAALLERITALETELDAERKAHEMAMAERNGEIAKLRAQIASQILELKVGGCGCGWVGLCRARQSGLASKHRL